MLNFFPPYTELNDANLPDTFRLMDHLGGFDANYKNIHLSKIKGNKTISLQFNPPTKVRQNYPNLNFIFDVDLEDKSLLNSFQSYNIHPELDYKNFVCSFNGSDHVGRRFLTSVLNKFAYFNKNYCSKNFKHTGNEISDSISNNVSNTEFYSKFFDCTDEFNQQVYSFGHVRFDHSTNICNLENKLTQSFLHIVSETLATSHCPFVTEKFLYSIVTRGLFLAYAQPGWHAYIEKYYGFKLYTRLFNYHFDSIVNPIERLVELMTMISKFSKLTPHEWHDLYLLESDTIEYNYNHYFSKSYLECIKKTHENQL
jgi:hypothetical protein